MLVLAAAVYLMVLTVLEFFLFRPLFLKRHRQEETISDDIRRNQYLYTERNTTKYLSMTYVWPEALHRPRMQDKAMIFCVVPHGVAPIGITAYPLWSKLWNDRLCRWTAAPIVLKLPLVGYFVRKVGYIPAKAASIVEALTKREENVGIILDGIAGMFHQSAKEERAYLKKRKGIVKIALKAGAPIVPVYGFGHTSMWTVVVDPFGICEAISNVTGAAVTPFFGRFGWFLGPPVRASVTVCLGEPVHCPKIDDPTQQQIDEYHAKLLAAYRDLFETHKEAYGWGNKTLKFV
jgi:1-acyl-sn-glycerol-3-phosphate acyltransferase